MSNRNKKTEPKPIAQAPENAQTLPVKSRFSMNLKLGFLLALISFCVYANTLKNSFVLDDSVMLINNEYVKKGISAIPKLLSTPHQQGYFDNPNDEYRPLALVMFAVEHQIFGLTPMPYHFMNILLFAGCVVLLFLFLDRMFDQKRKAVAFIASLLFALHPIHTEVVANIKSRDEILCFFLAFLSLNLLLKYVRSGKTSQLLAGFLCLFASLLAKETTITFLAVIPLLFFFYRDENRKRSMHIVAYTVAAAAAFLVIRFAVLSYYHANSIPDVDIIENALAKKGLSLESRLATAMLMMGYYIKLLFVPYPLSSDYSYNSIPFVHFSNPFVLLSLAGYIFFAAVGIRRFMKNHKDPLAFAFLFFLFTIALFSNMLFLIKSTMGERFLFFPSVGFCLAIALSIEKLTQKSALSGLSALKHPIVLLITIPVCLAYTVLTVNRNADWLDNFTLYKTDSGKLPRNARLNYLFGYDLFSLSKQYKDPEIQKKIRDDAVIAFKKALAVYPQYHFAESDLGAIYFENGELDSAEVHDRKAVELGPNSIVALNNLAGVCFTKKNYPEVINISKRALKVSVRDMQAYANIGVSYMFLSKFDSTVLWMKKAIEADPEYNPAYELMAQAYQAKGKRDSAIMYEGFAKLYNPKFKL